MLVKKCTFISVELSNIDKENNKCRALDYFKLAQDMAIEGDFKVHLDFVTSCIELLTESQPHRMSHNIGDISVEELLNQISDLSE